MALSSPGIGSNLDVNGIIRQLMAVESQSLNKLTSKEASYTAQLSAFGNLSGALGTFQSALSSLSSPTKFQTLNAATSDGTVASATSSTKAVAGSYNVNVTQLAQSQTIKTSGQTTTTAAIGTGTLTFQFGTITMAGAKLSGAVASGGIAAGSLSINGTTITTSASTTSAKALAEQINLVKGTTGVTATAQTTDTGALGLFTTTAGGDYSLSVGGVSIVSSAGAGAEAATIDAALINPTVAGNLANAGIAFTGTAVAGTLKFTKADGSNVAIQESGAGTTGGFTTTLGIGTTKTFTSAVSLSPGGATIAGTDPSLAGLTSGTSPTNGVYSSATFVQNASVSSGTVTIDSSNNSLQGIRDAINKANVGVTATIVSDGSAAPYHLVLTSTKTGVASSMKISASGDAALGNLLNYDPGNSTGQNLTETTAARDTALSVNGIAVSSATKTVSEAIQGVTLNLTKAGSATITVSRDTGSATSAINGLVKAYNDLNKTLKDLTSYNAETKKGGPLLGDATVRSIQVSIRQAMTMPITGLSGNLKTLTDVGISFQKDGTLSVNTTKMQNAINNNFDDIAGLFSVLGKTTDSLTSYVSSTTATKAGAYAIELTQAARQGTLTGNADLTVAPTVIAAASTINVTLDGKSATVSLTPGSYSATDLAAMLQSAINGTSAFVTAESSVTATIEGGLLKLTSNRYGSTSDVSLADGTGVTAASLVGGAPTSSAGQDVAGTIGGYAATGSGQNLTGGTGTPVEGLKLLATSIVAGSRGSISFTRGYGYQLNTLVEGFLGTSGLISSRTTGINSSIKDLGRTREDLNERLAAVEKRYRAQFTALDTAISSMNKTSSFLQQQLNNLPKIE